LLSEEALVMGYAATAWAIVLGMFVWAAYLYFHWAGVDALPMQWGLTGKPTWFAARGPALFFFPFLSAVVVGMIVFARRGDAPLGGAAFTAALLLVIQAGWVFFARRYV
jgi:hypothetical protein